MKFCTLLDDYLNNQLPLEQREQFEVHLEKCEDCSAEVAAWTSIGEQIGAIGNDLINHQADVSEISKQQFLKLYAQQEQTVSNLKPVWALAAAFTLLLGAVMVWQLGFKDVAVEGYNDSVSGDALRLSAISDRNANPKEVVAQGSRLATELNERLIVHLAKDVIGVAQNSHVDVEKATVQMTGLSLKKGTVACSVDPHRGDKKFVVQAGAYTVRVVGTRFAVTLTEKGGLRTAVERGVVEVVLPDGEVRQVPAGKQLTVYESILDDTVVVPQLEKLAASEKSALEQLLSQQPLKEIGATVVAEKDTSINGGTSKIAPHSEKSSVTGDNFAVKRAVVARRTKEKLKTLQQLVLKGEVHVAEKGLNKLLKNNPNSAEAWFLLADCKKRTQNYEASVSVYKRAIPYLPVRTANNARYRAGSILQDRLDNHNEAIALFKAFLNHKPKSQHLKAEALYRLARSYRAIGKEQLSRQTLEKIVQQLGDTAAAEKAKKLLR